MIDLNRKPEQKKEEEKSAGLIIGTVIVIAAWIVWAFMIGGML